MVLPFPVSSNTKVNIIDLSKYPDILNLLSDVFNDHVTFEDSDELKTKGEEKALKVHSVGVYNMSIVYSLKDLSRVDKKVFKLSTNLKSVFKEFYPKNYGFIICSFNPSKGIDGHPIAYVHDLSPDGLFVPTRYYDGGIDGRIHKERKFDHQIFTINAADNYRAGTKYHHHYDDVFEILYTFEPLNNFQLGRYSYYYPLFL